MSVRRLPASTTRAVMAGRVDDRVPYRGAPRPAMPARAGGPGLTQRVLIAFVGLSLVVAGVWLTSWNLGFLSVGPVAPVSLYPASMGPTPALYGSAIGADSLINSVVGGESDNRVAYRFRATRTERLDSIVIYLQMGEGYSSGSGGTLSITLETDDGYPTHHPSGEVLAERQIRPRSGAGIAVRFSGRPLLEAGELYHLVFENIDPEPASNYASLNGLFVFDDDSSDQPAFSRTDWANLVESRGTPWSDDRGPDKGTITPILGLHFADGSSSGVGYMEVWVGQPEAVGGDDRARQVFTVRGPDRPVAGAAVRLERIAGSAPLMIELRDRNDRVIDVATIDSGRIRQGTVEDIRGSTWVWGEFAKPQRLASGESYSLELSTAEDTTYLVHVVRKGSSYGYGDGTYFADGQGETSDGGPWQPFSGWGGPNPEGDLQFYLR